MENPRAHHDIGGLAAGPIDQSEHRLSLSERRIDAMMQLLYSPQLKMYNIDEMRHAIECLPREVYERYNYYERWIMVIEKLLIEKGAIGRAELDAKLADVRRRFA